MSQWAVNVNMHLRVLLLCSVCLSIMHFWKCLLYILLNKATVPLQMEQIKRANRMYTNDSIFLKTSLSIPVLSDFGGVQSEDSSGCAAAENRQTGIPSEKKADDGQGKASDLSPMEFLKRLDGFINQSKQAAVGGRQEAEKRSVHLPIHTVITTHPAISFTFIAV